jgi:hypothetical protein
MTIVGLIQGAAVIEIGRRKRRQTGPTGITISILVGVRLAEIADEWAIIPSIRHGIIIVVTIARVPLVIGISVGLIWIRHGDAVVTGIADTVLVAVAVGVALASFVTRLVFLRLALAGRIALRVTLDVTFVRAPGTAGVLKAVTRYRCRLSCSRGRQKKDQCRGGRGDVDTPLQRR